MKNLFYKIFINKTENTKLQFFRYLFAGGFAAIVNIGCLYVFTEIIQIYYLISNIIGFIAGLITNYLLSKLLVFSTENKINKVLEFIMYGVIGLIGLGLDTIYMWIGTSKLGIYYLLTKIISTGLVLIWNFFGKKFLYVLVDKKKGI